ncbi:MAG: phage holin family protein [Cyanobacteria bacterium J06598_1]
MLGFVITTLVTALSLLVADIVLKGVAISTFPAALLAAVSLGLVNAFIKPVLKLLSLPVTFLTLGGFSLIVNGFCFWLASLVVPGFAVHGLLAFILGPVVLSLASTFIMGYFVKNDVEAKLTGVASKLGLNKAEGDRIEAATKQDNLEATKLS